MQDANNVMPEAAAHVLAHLAKNAAMQAPDFTFEELASSMSFSHRKLNVQEGLQHLLAHGFVRMNALGYVQLRSAPVGHMSIAAAGNLLQSECYGASKARGWWQDREGCPLLEMTYAPYVVATKLMLAVGELAEGMEGNRKDQMDDHLPHRPSLEVELADAVIRIADLSGAMGYKLGEAIAEKMAYNAKRADHDLANRAAAGGKKY